MDGTKKLCRMLDELGVEHETYVLPNGKRGVSWIDGNNIEWEAVQLGENFEIHALQLVTPEQAIAATVGDKPKDNPRNYNPDGTPKIPNMNIGADPDWVDWVASLEHEEPLSLKEAVEQLMFEVICFGGDMGPNDCGGEHCPDDGMVYTNDFINGWVNKIAATVGERYYTYDEWRAINEAVGDAMEYAHEHAVMYPDKADPLWNIDEYVNRVLEVVYGPKDATVGARDIMGLWHEWEQVLFANVSDEVAQDNLNECVHDLLDKAATIGAGTLTAEQVRECLKGVYFDGYSDGATHRVNGIEETDWQAIADKLNATLGAGTCHIEECEHEREIPYDLPDCDGGWYTEVTYDCDECGYENTDPNIRFCGGCGRKVVSE